MEDKIFTLEETSRYLNIPKSTLYKLSQRKELPSCKIGKQLRFRQSSLDQWLAQKEQGWQKDSKPDSLFIEKNGIDYQGEGCRILLIDDDRVVLRSISRLLSHYGYSVESAANAREAMEKLEKGGFHLLIADIRMPNLSGLEIIKKARALHAHTRKPRIPEILITGFVDRDAEQEAENLGITDLVYKPFTINDFINTVRKRLTDTPASN